jgi:hypothetical protein
MSLPSFINEKAIRQAGGIVVALFALFILWKVFESQLVAMSQDIETTQTNTETIKQQNQTMLDTFVRETRRTNVIIQKQCENDASNDKEFRNCTIPE